MQRTVNTIAALFSSRSGTFLLCPDLSDPAERVLQISDSDLLTIQFLLQSSQEKEMTRLRSELLGGNFFCFRELRHAKAHVTLECKEYQTVAKYKTLSYC